MWGRQETLPTKRTKRHMERESYDPDLTELLLEEGGKRIDESRRILEELDARLDDPAARHGGRQ